MSNNISENKHLITTKFTLEPDKSKDGKESDLWLIAAKKNDIKMMKKLIKRKNTKGINSIDEEKHSPLMIASKNDNLEAVETIVGAGGNIFYITPRDCSSAFYYAAINGNLNIIKFLLLAGFSDRSHIGYSLNGSIYYDNYEIVETLLKLIPVDGRYYYTTPLITAAREGKTEIMKLLHRSGADLYSKDWNEAGAMYGAIYDDRLESVKLLIELGFDINWTDRYHRTPLFYAVIYNKPKCVDLLLDLGADTEIYDNDGETPLYYCTKPKGYPLSFYCKRNIQVEELNRKHIIESLLNVGADIYKETPNCNSIFNSINFYDCGSIFKKHIQKLLKNRFIEVIMIFLKILPVLPAIEVYQHTLDENKGEITYQPSTIWKWDKGKEIKDILNKKTDSKKIV